MQVSARDFKSSQGKYLKAARTGKDVFIKSRFGNFKVTAVPENSVISPVDLTQDIIDGLRDVKKIKEGRLIAKPARTLLDEL